MTSRNRNALAGKTLLIISAGIEQIPGILRAKRLGLFVVATDGNPRAPGFAYADAHGVASTYDVPATVAFAKHFSRAKRRIDGVMTLASDVPMTVAAVARALRLPGHSLATARRATDKLLMKRVFARAGVAIPAFAPVRTAEDAKRFAKRHGFPVVIKPVDSRGARGVQRIQSAAALSGAVKLARRESPTGRVMVEAFLSGPQFSTESLVYKNRIYTTGLSDRNYEFLERYAPHIIENGGDLPASLTAAQRRELDRVLLKAARALGITSGTMKGDAVWTAAGPRIIEVAARLSGGYFATDEVPLSTGVNLAEQAIRVALGASPQLGELKSKFHRAVSERFFFPQKPGVIRNIRGVARAKRGKHIVRFVLYAERGDRVEPVRSHPSRAGYVMTCAPTRKEAIAAAEKAVRAVTFVID